MEICNLQLAIRDIEWYNDEVCNQNQTKLNSLKEINNSWETFLLTDVCTNKHKGCEGDLDIVKILCKFLQKNVEYFVD